MDINEYAIYFTKSVKINRDVLFADASIMSCEM